MAQALGYKDTVNAVKAHVDEEDRMVNEMFTVNGPHITIINESGLYSLVLSCKRT